MRPRLGGLPAAVVLLLVSAGAHAAEIGRIRAHLVYEETGRLSSDLVSDPGFAAWNTIIGEGSAEEIAGDMLVFVEVVGTTRGEENIEGQLEISARGPDGRVLARRRYDGMLTSADGRIWKSLWLPDSTCAGTIAITATIGNSSRTAELSLECGE